jgi:HK97 family phage portal protein
VTEFFEFPDGEHTFGDWLRPLAEDVLVLDAPALEPVRTRGGELKQLLVIDGATIFPVIDPATGFTPVPPAIAYQQIIKGVIAATLTTDDLIYRPRNRRVHKLYGFSPVEQIALTVNLGLRRQMSQLAYYTDGTVPDAYLGVPETWTPEQITEYQQVFDAYLAGNLQNRRKVFLGPDGKLQLLKEPALKAEMDEWLARIVCFAFSISPHALVREMNRATAQTAKEQSLEEGLWPLLAYFAALFNSIIRKYFGIADLEFVWQDEKAEDPKDQAEIAANLVSKGIITPNEARQRLGLEPREGGDQLGIVTASGFVPIQQSAFSS